MVADVVLTDSGVVVAAVVVHIEKLTGLWLCGCCSCYWRQNVDVMMMLCYCCCCWHQVNKVMVLVILLSFLTSDWGCCYCFVITAVVVVAIRRSTVQRCCCGCCRLKTDSIISRMTAVVWFSWLLSVSEEYQRRWVVVMSVVVISLTSGRT